MLCVSWNFDGIVHFELAPSGRAIRAELHCQQLERVYEKLKKVPGSDPGISKTSFRYPRSDQAKARFDAAGQCQATYLQEDHGQVRRTGRR